MDRDTKYSTFIAQGSVDEKTCNNVLYFTVGHYKGTHRGLRGEV